MLQDAQKLMHMHKHTHTRTKKDSDTKGQTNTHTLSLCLSLILVSRSLSNTHSHTCTPALFRMHTPHTHTRTCIHIPCTGAHTHTHTQVPRGPGRRLESLCIIPVLDLIKLNMGEIGVLEWNISSENHLWGCEEFRFGCVCVGKVGCVCAPCARARFGRVWRELTCNIWTSSSKQSSRGADRAREVGRKNVRARNCVEIESLWVCCKRSGQKMYGSNIVSYGVQLLLNSLHHPCLSQNTIVVL